MKQKLTILFLLAFVVFAVGISSAHAQEKRPAGFDPNAMSKSWGTGNNSGITTNRSRAEHGSSLGAGQVYETQQPVRKCPCRGADIVKWGTFCAPQNYIYNDPPPADWNNGVVYLPGQFAC